MTIDEILDTAKRLEVNASANPEAIREDIVTIAILIQALAKTLSGRLPD